jgi:hypothetical protein
MVLASSRCRTTARRSVPLMPSMARTSTAQQLDEIRLLHVGLFSRFETVQECHRQLPHVPTCLVVCYDCKLWPSAAPRSRSAMSAVRHQLQPVVGLGHYRPALALPHCSREARPMQDAHSPSRFRGTGGKYQGGFALPTVLGMCARASEIKHCDAALPSCKNKGLHTSEIAVKIAV